MDLYERLRAQKSKSVHDSADSLRPRGADSGSAPAGGADPAVSLSAAGFSRLDDFLWTRTREFAVEPLPAAFFREGAAARLIYFDTETTGLSGGSGTTVFLVGLGRLAGGSLIVEQVFLEDFPGEPRFLEYLADAMPAEATYVSYNGKAFDTHVLTMRHLMNGRHVGLPKQLDLLYPARRLWKSMLDSCALGAIEEHVLGITREVDIPGFLIPDTYFDFLRSGDATPLEPVFEHHSADIVSLHRLLVQIERLAHDPWCVQADRFQLARLLYSRDPARGEALLRQLAAADGRAALELGRCLKRQQRFDDAAEVFRSLYERNGSPSAGVELAKYHEHRTKALLEAREIVLSLLSRPDCAPVREELRYRLDRLERKLASL